MPSEQRKRPSYATSDTVVFVDDMGRPPPNTWSNIVYENQQLFRVATYRQETPHALASLERVLVRQTTCSGNEPELGSALSSALFTLVNELDSLGITIESERDLTMDEYAVGDGLAYGDSPVHKVLASISTTRKKMRQSLSSDPPSLTSPPSVISAASLFTSERGGLNIPDFTAVRWCTEHGGSHGAPCLTFEVKSFTNALDRALRVRDFVFRVRSAASRLRGESEKAAVETEAQVANEIDATLELDDATQEINVVSTIPDVALVLGSIQDVPHIAALAVEPTVPPGGPTISWASLEPPAAKRQKWREAIKAADALHKTRMGLAQEICYGISALFAFGSQHGLVLIAPGTRLSLSGLLDRDDLYDALLPHSLLCHLARDPPAIPSGASGDLADTPRRLLDFGSIQLMLNWIAAAFACPHPTSDCVSRPPLAPASDFAFDESVSFTADEAATETAILRARPKVAAAVLQAKDKERKRKVSAGSTSAAVMPPGPGSDNGGGGGSGGAGPGGSSGAEDGSGGDIADGNTEGKGTEDKSPDDGTAPSPQEATETDLDSIIPFGVDFAAYTRDLSAETQTYTALYEVLASLEGYTVVVVAPHTMDSLMADHGHVTAGT